MEHMELDGNRHIPIQDEQKPINTHRHSPKWERLSLLCQKTAGQDTYRLSAVIDIQENLTHEWPPSFLPILFKGLLKIYFETKA